MDILRGIDWLLGLDVKVELLLNQLVGRYPWFDSAMVTFNSLALVNSAVVILLLWLVVFPRRHTRKPAQGVDLLLRSAFLCLLSTMVALSLVVMHSFCD